MMKRPAPRQAPSLMIALKRIFEGTSAHTGKPFFRQLVKELAEVLQVHGVWVTEYLEETHELNSLAFWLNGRFVEQYRYAVKGTPCEPVLKADTVCHVPDRVIELYPDDPDLPPLGAVSYMGLALKDKDGKVLGHLALLDQQPMEEIPEVFVIFQLFAACAAAELRRLHDEKKLQDSESKLSRLLNGTMDAIVELNTELKITQANESAHRTFRVHAGRLTGQDIRKFLTPEGYRKLQQAIPFAAMPRTRPGAHWIQGYLQCVTATGDEFPADATLSGYTYNNRHFYALYIRNVQDRLQREAEIQQLTVETTMLREKVSNYQMNQIIGESAAIQHTFAQIQQVAATDSTVLILGETGTGKELVAREIFRQSLRSDKPFITLNCAALPAELIESELFGHVKGAFTGAVQAREGRFLLADKGTLFLDEIGELPLALQAKLLRVVQYGEFEQVGSSFTRRVNVRIIAATHRDLKKEVAAGKFREDLYYRLHVFPLYLPPLRERGNDILLLAEAFLAKYAARYGRPQPTLSEADKQQLLHYHWPGNVRELQNIMERAVITSREGSIQLTGITASEASSTHNPAIPEKILTAAQLEQLERENMERALRATKGKVFGADGAAALIGIPPTTLSSRMKKLGIHLNRFK